MNEASSPLIFRWRSECQADTDRLLELIPKDEIVRFEAVQVGPFPDVVNEITLRKLSLKALRNLMRKVPDGHVMVQTVQPKEKYTGVRNYDLKI